MSDEPAFEFEEDAEPEIADSHYKLDFSSGSGSVQRTNSSKSKSGWSDNRSAGSTSPVLSRKSLSSPYVRRNSSDGKTASSPTLKRSSQSEAAAEPLFDTTYSMASSSSGNTAQVNSRPFPTFDHGIKAPASPRLSHASANGHRRTQSGSPRMNNIAESYYGVNKGYRRLSATSFEEPTASPGRRRGASPSLLAGSPPFSSSMPTQMSGSPGVSPHKPVRTSSAPGDLPTLSTSPHNNSNHILDLLHAPRSNTSGPPTSSVFSPPGVHALLRNSALSALAPPALSLPSGPDDPDINSHWPEPRSFGSPSLRPASPQSPTGLSPASPAHPGLTSPNSFVLDPAPPAKLRRTSSHEGEAYSPHSNSESENEEMTLRQARRRRRRMSSGSRGSSLERSGDESDGSASGKREKVKHAHLAMPERSGYDFSDEEDEASDEDEGDEEEGEIEDEEEESQVMRPRGSVAGLPAALQRSDSPQERTARARSASPESQQVKPISPKDICADPEWPAGDNDEANTMERFFDSPEARVDPMITDDESLSVLERIFIFSKSEYREHRTAVARALPDWLESVDICEAVEYILPLLNGLAADEDEVKIGLAQGLDRIMMYFFSRCPLAESEDSKNEFHDTEMEHSAFDSSSPHLHLSPPTIPGQAEATSPIPADASTDEVIEPPKLLVGSFTPILGLLLMDTHLEVTSWARASVVRFLCRLYEKELPTYHMDEDQPPVMATPAKGEHDVARAHDHHPYSLTTEARSALERQILFDVVLGLARLEGEEDQDPEAMEGVESETSIADDQDQLSSSPPGSKSQGSDDGWGSPESQDTTMQIESSSPDWGMPLRPFMRHATQSPLMLSGSTPINHGRYFSSATASDNETTQGKMASMELIASIAEANCLAGAQLADTFVPEISRLVTDPAFRVRSLAASAIGPMAKVVPYEAIISTILPLMDSFANDVQPSVRRWACLVLPEIFGRLPDDIKRSRAIVATAKFSRDNSREVRSALTEISGQLIHLFVDTTVPDELLEWYLGGSAAQENKPAPNSNPFAPLPTALSSLKSSISTDSDKSASYIQSFDPERAMICAFNFPAVALSLGAKQWSKIRSFHASLARHEQYPVRRSLAASLHAVAKIIGSEQALADLAGLFKSFLSDSSPEVREMAIDQSFCFIAQLPSSANDEYLDVLKGAVVPDAGNPMPWRLREKGAAQLSSLTQQLLSNLPEKEDASTPFFDMLRFLMKDEVAAVRDAALRAIPSIYKLAQEHGESMGFVVRFLRRNFAEDVSYRHRTTYVNAVSTLIEAGAPRECFEIDLLPTLSTLAKDPIVNVRLALAKLLRQLVTKGFYHPPNLRHLSFDQIYLSLLSDSDATVREMLANPQFEPLLQSANTMRNHSTLSRSNSGLETSPNQPSLSQPASSPLPKQNGLTNGTHPPHSRSRSRSLSAESDDADMLEEDLTSSTLRDMGSLSSGDFEDMLSGSPTDSSPRPYSNLQHKRSSSHLEHAPLYRQPSRDSFADDHDFVRIDVD